LGFDNSRVCMLRKTPIGTLEMGTSTSWTCFRAGNRSSGSDVTPCENVPVPRRGRSEESFRVDRWEKVVDSWRDRRKVTIEEGSGVAIVIVLHRGRYSGFMRAACLVRWPSSTPLPTMSIAEMPAWVMKWSTADTGVHFDRTILDQRQEVDSARVRHR